MFDKRFEGWYYKQSNGDITVAFIPGEADDGAFVQVITDSGSHIFRTEKLKIKGDTVKTGNCFFFSVGDKSQIARDRCRPALHKDHTPAFRHYGTVCKTSDAMQARSCQYESHGQRNIDNVRKNLYFQKRYRICGKRQRTLFSEIVYVGSVQ